MTDINIEPFKVIGIAIRTTNLNGEAAKDIPGLWQRFMEQNILAKIPGKLDDTIYSIYTDYEGDFTKPYLTLLGCRVNSLQNIPDGMTGKHFEGGKYVKFKAQGDLTQGLVYEAWNKIWNTEINRKYTADFEVYGEKAQNQKDAEVEIYISVVGE